MKNKMVAGILAIFLGGLGVHKFYLGKIGMGFLYLIFCWTGIPAIIAFIEGIIYLVMNQREFDIKYNNGVNTGANSTYSAADELQKLKKLLDDGVITQEEFDRKRQELI